MPNSKQRRKGSLAPITYDELLGDSSMRGLISFLDVKPGAPEHGAPKVTAPELSAPMVTAPSVGAPDLIGRLGNLHKGGAETRAPEVTPLPRLVPPIQVTSARERNADAPTLGAPELPSQNASLETGVFELDSPEIIYRRPQEILREARQAQDGHTIGEQRLYDTLWRLGRPVPGNAKAVTIGERTLAGQANMSYSAVQDNARSLARKMGIEVRAATSKNAPKTYVVFSYEEILKRRRAAGLTHYVRRTSAVELVAPRKVGAPISGAPLFDRLSEKTTKASVDVNVGAPSIGALEGGAPEFPSDVLSALRKTVMKADDEAALRIVAECRKVAPDVTNAEVAELILTDAPLIARNKNIHNPIGVLIKHIPRCCGENLKQLRAEKEARIQREKKEEKRIAKAILEDAESSDEDRSWARGIVGE